MTHSFAYAKAVDEIQKTKKYGLASVNLAGMGLKSIPDELRNFKNLTKLNLSNNELRALPEWLKELTQLEALSLTDTRLSSIPTWIKKLTKLKSLDLDGNQIIELPLSIGNLYDLQILDISKNQINTLPDTIGNLCDLQILDISKNQINILPDAIGNLHQLQALDISNNQLKILPNTFGTLHQLQELNSNGNKLTSFPDTLGNLTKLQTLDLSGNRLISLPENIGNLIELRQLILSGNYLRELPDSLCSLKNLSIAVFDHNELKKLPEKMDSLQSLSELSLGNNQLIDIPTSIAKLHELRKLVLLNNPISPELSAAYKEGIGAVKTYLYTKGADKQVILNEAKLILVGEGEVGKSCLLGALRGDEWEEGRPTTHGIEIKPVKIINQENGKEITLNGWDFGGQRVYRPTHQLFFSAPAVYLVVWKPREGPQQGFVKEWIRLIKHREPEAKILVVATHGGPGQRQPDIDRQELRDLFGKETIIDFFFVESKPDEFGVRKGIPELKKAIAKIAAGLPEMGRSVPKSFQDVRKELQKTEEAYLPLERVISICYKHSMNDETARLFVNISHRLGHLIHYQYDPTLRDIVILKPDWLATAISFVLDDEETRCSNGLVSFSRLTKLWNDPTRSTENRYVVDLHPIFLRLMERFDLSYRVAGLNHYGLLNETSLIAQLVPDNRPEDKLEQAWLGVAAKIGDNQQIQICRIVDEKGNSATAEGLFYQLIVRLHKYSLGRAHYSESVHWQRGLILDDDYNGRALLEHIGNDVRISVRAAYPERFLAMLTGEVKYLVESFWEGLRCNIMVPCVEPCGKNMPGIGLFEVEKLIESKRRGRPEFPCPVCDEWQNIDVLLRNAPAAQSDSTALIFDEFDEIKTELAKVRQQLAYQGGKVMGRFDRLDDRTRRILSRVDKTYTDLLQIFLDEAKEGPRLFSFVPVDRKIFNPKQWTSAKFRLTLWCEHTRLPLPYLNGQDSEKGVYEIEITRSWYKKAAPFLNMLTTTLSLILPVASSGIKLAMDDNSYKAIEKQLSFSKDTIDAILDGSEQIGEWLGGKDTTSLEQGEAIRAQGATLREFQALLKAKDPGFGGLVRVMNKRQEFLWVHESFAGEY